MSSRYGGAGAAGVTLVPRALVLRVSFFRIPSFSSKPSFSSGQVVRLRLCGKMVGEKMVTVEVY